MQFYHKILTVLEIHLKLISPNLSWQHGKLCQSLVCCHFLNSQTSIGTRSNIVKLARLLLSLQNAQSLENVMFHAYKRLVQNSNEQFAEWSLVIHYNAKLHIVSIFFCFNQMQATFLSTQFIPVLVMKIPGILVT